MEGAGTHGELAWQTKRERHEMNTHLLAADPRVSNLTQKHQQNQHVQTDLLAITHTLSQVSSADTWPTHTATHTHIHIHAHTHTHIHTHTHTHTHAVGTRLWNYLDTADLRAV